MKQSEFIITAVLVLAAFGLGFYNITNSTPTVNNTQMNASVSIEASSTNETVNLNMVPFVTETIEEDFYTEMDTILSIDSIAEEVSVE
jgi:hypothetical protein